MRIILLTAGTGSFHCGTCMRDNALITALRRQGHDALLVPLYLPLVLDETAATDGAPLFYGGINVYLQEKSRLFRKTPRWLDRLFDSPRMLRAAAKKAGMTKAGELGEITLSMLRGEEGRQGKELDRLTSWLASDGRADVVCLSNALLMGLARRIKQQTGAAVVCTLQGEDTFLDSLPEPHRREAWETLAARAADVDAFLAVSRYHGDLMRERARLPAERLHVVHNGILLDGYPESRVESRESKAAIQTPTLGYLARMSPLKGLETLVEAYLLLRQRNHIPNLRLHVAGTRTTADEAFVSDLWVRLIKAGVALDVRFQYNISRAEKIAFLQGLSVLSVPATYGESFGLYVIEALAAGVPVVQPRHAAFPELLEATGGGLLCEPDDPQSLADAVEELLCDPDRARAMGEAGRKIVFEKFHVDAMARNVVNVFEWAVKRQRGTTVTAN